MNAALSLLLFVTVREYVPALKPVGNSATAFSFCEGSEHEWGMCEGNRRSKPRRAEIIAFNSELVFGGIHHGAVDGHRRGSQASTCGDGSECG
jgi:hypothetical protein